MTVLRRRGLDADVARNGLEALEKLAAHSYELMLLDLMMPHVNGYEVVDHLSAQPCSARPLVVVLTAGMEPRALDTSVVIGTLHKPFDIELLVDTVLGCITVRNVGPQPIATVIQAHQQKPN